MVQSVLGSKSSPVNIQAFGKVDFTLRRSLSKVLSPWSAFYQCQRMKRIQAILSQINQDQCLIIDNQVIASFVLKISQDKTTNGGHRTKGMPARGWILWSGLKDKTRSRCEKDFWVDPHVSHLGIWPRYHVTWVKEHDLFFLQLNHTILNVKERAVASTGKWMTHPCPTSGHCSLFLWDTLAIPSVCPLARKQGRLSVSRLRYITCSSNE